MKYISVIAVVFLFFSFSALGEEKEPKGFGGVSWGDPVPQEVLNCIEEDGGPGTRFWNCGQGEESRVYQFHPEMGLVSGTIVVPEAESLGLQKQLKEDLGDGGELISPAEYRWVFPQVVVGMFIRDGYFSVTYVTKKYLESTR